MILVILEVNGKIYWRRSKRMETAQKAVVPWLSEAKKKFPNATFIPKYFEATRLARS